MKTKFIFYTLMLFCLPAVAQKAANYQVKPRVGVGLNLSLPINKEFSQNFTIGFGGAGKVEVPITKSFYATATAGFITFYLKEEVKNLKINKSYIPLKAGGKYYFGQYYAEGELGVAFGTQQNAGSALIYSPGAGVSLPITKKGYLDAGVRYEAWQRSGGNLDQVVFKLAYKF